MSKKTKNIFSFIIFMVTIAIIATPFFVRAQTDFYDDAQYYSEYDTQPFSKPSSGIKFKIENPFKQDSIEGFIKTIIKEILIPIGAVIATLMIMYAGFKFVTARGNPAEITKAKDALLYGVIGAAILLGAWVISEAISATINQLKK